MQNLQGKNGSAWSGDNYRSDTAALLYPPLHTKTVMNDLQRPLSTSHILCVWSDHAEFLQTDH